MDNRKEKEGFSYIYSANEQEELKKIRQKYESPKENKMEQLRRLDRGVYEKGTMAAIIIGVIGAVLLGIGMCCTMIWQEMMFIPGIIIGLVGIGILTDAYPIYNHITEKEREKVAPEIIRLADELMK